MVLNRIANGLLGTSQMTGNSPTDIRERAAHVRQVAGAAYDLVFLVSGEMGKTAAASDFPRMIHHELLDHRLRKRQLSPAVSLNLLADQTVFAPAANRLRRNLQPL